MSSARMMLMVVRIAIDELVNRNTLTKTSTFSRAGEGVMDALVADVTPASPEPISSIVKAILDCRLSCL